MAIIGYARVSTSDQNIISQIDQLTAAGCTEIFQDAASGKNDKREELQNCLRYLRDGDTLIVTEMSRLGRSVSDTVRILDDLRKREIHFLSLKESIHILANSNDSSMTGLMSRFFAMFISILAEMERSFIVDRTKKGLEAARARGRFGGRPRKLSSEKIKILLHAYESKEMEVTTIAENMGISVKTMYNYLDKYRNIG